MVLRFRGAERIYADGNEWVGIIKKHLPTGDIIEAQEDLIDAGLQMYARLK